MTNVTYRLSDVCLISIATSRTKLVHSLVKSFQYNSTDCSYLSFLQPVWQTIQNKWDALTKQNNRTSEAERDREVALHPLVTSSDPERSRGQGELTWSRWILKYMRCLLVARDDQWQAANRWDLLRVSQSLRPRGRLSSWGFRGFPQSPKQVLGFKIGHDHLLPRAFQPPPPPAWILNRKCWTEKHFRTLYGQPEQGKDCKVTRTIVRRLLLWRLPEVLRSTHASLRKGH
jgi:hypothetical protein